MNKEILISATDLKKYFPVHKFMGGKLKMVDPKADIIKEAKIVGISFGDE